MASVKVREWVPGHYAHVLGPQDRQVTGLEVEVLEKLLAGPLPPGCFMISADLEVCFHCGGAAEEVKSFQESWSKVWTFKTDLKKDNIVLEPRQPSPGFTGEGNPAGEVNQ